METIPSSTTPTLMANYSSLLTEEYELNEDDFQRYISSNNVIKALLQQAPAPLPNSTRPCFSSMKEDGYLDLRNENHIRTLLLYVLDKLNSLVLQSRIEADKNTQLTASLRELEMKLNKSNEDSKEMIKETQRTRSYLGEELEHTLREAEILEEQRRTSEKIDKLQQDLYEFDCRLIEVEQDLRKDSLIISGIPKSVTEDNLESKVMEAMASIDCPVKTEDITRVQRLGRLGRWRFPCHTLVEFSNYKYVQYCLENRDLLLDAKTDLKMNLRFYKHLCGANELVRRACKMLRESGEIYDYHLDDGFVAMVVKDGDEPIKIPHINVLKDKFPSTSNI